MFIGCMTINYLKNKKTTRKYRARGRPKSKFMLSIMNDVVDVKACIEVWIRKVSYGLFITRFFFDYFKRNILAFVCAIILWSEYFFLTKKKDLHFKSCCVYSNKIGFIMTMIIPIRPNFLKFVQRLIRDYLLQSILTTFLTKRIEINLCDSFQWRLTINYKQVM